MSANATLAPAQAFPPGEFVADEIEARGWTKSGFAEIIGRPVQAVSEILNGKKAITVETAAEIAAATGTEAVTWLNLQTSYRVWQLAQDSGTSPKLDEVTRRARLATIAPVRELRLRGLLRGGIDDEEHALRELFDVNDLRTPPHFAVAARRSNGGDGLSAVQTTWLACAFRVAHSVDVDRTPGATGGSSSIADIAAALTTVINSPDLLADLPGRLARSGVCFVYVPAFRGSRIDGAAFTIDGAPVIAISGRIPRFDSVLFTVLHELAHHTLGHVGDAVTLDDEELGSSAPEDEANELAGRWAVGEQFRAPSVLSRIAISRAAHETGVHPSVIVGRLQRDGVLPSTHLNGLVPNVRDQLSILETPVDARKVG